MFEVSCSQEIRRSPDEVFAFAGDYSNDPSWRTGVLAMEYVTPGSPAIGTRTRETMRSMGRTVVTIAEVTEYAPARTAFRSLSGPIQCEGSREFLPTSTGTRFTYSLALRPAGALRLLVPLLKRVLSRQVRADVLHLKQQLETGTQGARPGSGTPLATRVSAERETATGAPYLRYYHSPGLRSKTLAALERLETAPDPTQHRMELADVVVELTRSGMDA